MILQALALAWLAGAGLASLGAPYAPLIAIAAGVALALWQGSRLRPIATIVLAIALGAVAFAGTIAAAPTKMNGALGDVSSFIDVAGPKRVQGVVSADRQQTASALLLRLSVQRVETDSGWHDATGTLLVRAPLSLAYDYGDQIEVRGQLIRPLTGGAFDYAAYLARQGVFAEMIYPSTHLIAHNQGNPMQAELVHLRERLAAGIASILPEPEASLGAGIALSTSRVIDPTLKHDLSVTGATWIVTGAFKVTLVGIFVGLALSWLAGRRRARSLSVLAVVGYTFLVGFYPADVRAAIMGALFVLAFFAGRPFSRMRLLILTVALISLPYGRIPVGSAFPHVFAFLPQAFSPDALRDPSFLASVVTVGALLSYTEPLLDVVSRRRRPGQDTQMSGLARFLLEGVVATIVSTVVSFVALPAISHEIPLIFPLASLILTPIVWLLMAVSAVAAVAGAVAHPIAVAVEPLAYVPLAFMVRVVRLCAKLPGGYLSTRGLPPLLAALLAAMGASVARFARPYRRVPLPGAAGLSARGALSVDVLAVARPLKAKLKAKLRLLPWPAASASRTAVVFVFVAALASAGGSFLVSHRASGTAAHVTVLDVGPGSAVLVQAGGRRALIDGGPPGQATLRALDARLPPWQRSLDLVVITAASDAYAGGLPAVLGHYRVGAVLDLSQPTATGKPSGPTAQALAIALGSSTAIPIPARPWMAVSLGPARLVIQAAQANAPGARPTVTLTTGQRQILLAGDSLGIAAADVRLLPATQVQTPVQLPRVAILESGPPARTASDLTGVPAAFRSSLLYRTNENGTISISTDGKDIRVTTSRGNKRGLFASP